MFLLDIMSKRKIQKTEKIRLLMEKKKNAFMNEKRKYVKSDQINGNVLNSGDKKKLTLTRSKEGIKCLNVTRKLLNGSNRKITKDKHIGYDALSTDDTITTISDTNDLTTSKSQLDESQALCCPENIDHEKQLLVNIECNQFNDVIRNLPTMTNRERVLYWKTSDQVSDIEDYSSFCDKYDKTHEQTKQRNVVQQKRNMHLVDNIYSPTSSTNLSKKRKKLLKKNIYIPVTSNNANHLLELNHLNRDHFNDNSSTSCTTISEPFRREQSDSYVHKKYDLINTFKATSTCTQNKIKNVNNSNVSDNKSSILIRYDYIKQQTPTPVSSQSIAINLDNKANKKLIVTDKSPEINTKSSPEEIPLKRNSTIKTIFKIPNVPIVVPQKRRLLNPTTKEIKSKAHNGMHSMNMDNSHYNLIKSMDKQNVKPIENSIIHITSSKTKKGDSNRDEFYKYLGIGSKSQSDSKNENALNDEHSKRRSLRVRLQKMSITVVDNQNKIEGLENDEEIISENISKTQYSYVQRSPRKLIVKDNAINVAESNCTPKPCTSSNVSEENIVGAKSCLIKYTYVKDVPDPKSMSATKEITASIQIKENNIISPIMSQKTPTVSYANAEKHVNNTEAIKNDNSKLHEKNANEMSEKEKAELASNTNLMKTYNGRKTNLLKNKENSICDSSKLKEPINSIPKLSPKVNAIEITKRRYTKFKVIPVNHFTRSSRTVRSANQIKTNKEVIIPKKSKKILVKNMPKHKSKVDKILQKKHISEVNTSKNNYTDSSFVNSEWFTDDDEDINKIESSPCVDSKQLPSNSIAINDDNNSCKNEKTLIETINIVADKVTKSLKIDKATNNTLETVNLGTLKSDVKLTKGIINKTASALDIRMKLKPNDTDLSIIPSGLATTSTSNNNSTNQMLNPIKDENGPVLSAYYTKEILIIVQKKLISYWKYSKIVSIIGALQTWELIDQIVRQDKDIEIDTPYDNRLCYNDDKPVYLEFRAKESPPDNIRECIICFVYINVYYLSNSTNELLANVTNNNNNNNNNNINNPSSKAKKCDKNKTNDNYKLKMGSIQLDTIWGSSSTICYTTLPNSCYFVMSWTDAKRSGVCKYCLTPDLCSLASIREFPCLSHSVLRLQPIDDFKLAGIGKTELSMWDNTTGDLLISIDLEIELGSNLSCYLFNEKSNNYIFLMQLMNTTDDNQVMKLFAIHVASDASGSRTVHTVRTLDIPPTCKTLLSSFNSNNFFVATFKEGDILLTTLNNQQSVIVSNEKNITITHNGYIIEIGKYLTLKTISEYLLEIAIR